MPSLLDCEFAVVDVETTGLFHKRQDRIVEIAIIRVDGNGSILDEYATLVNPHRDLGPTHIHGISARDVKFAPNFVEILGDVLRRIAGAVFVAHNVHFDFGFLQSEVNRVGQKLPRMPMLCTMQLAKKVATCLPSRKLEVCCQHFGIAHQHSHSAYHDALAVSSLLAELIRRMKECGTISIADIGIEEHLLDRKHWPNIPASGKSFTRQHANEVAATDVPYINRLISSLPIISGGQSELDEYLALLDRVLEDRRLTDDEAEALLSVCTEYGISRDQALDANYLYLRDLIRVALADGIITRTEQNDLDEVRKLLLISRCSFQDLLSIVEQEVAEKEIQKRPLTCTRENVTGKTICFTGPLKCKVQGKAISRSDATSMAEQRGMVPKSSVTRQLDFLVAADPDSLSGKAQKARDYGARIIAETVFWRMIGVEID